MVSLFLLAFFPTPNPFSFLSGDPRQALWVAFLICCGLLGIEALVFFWIGKPRPHPLRQLLTGLSLAGSLASFAFALVASKSLGFVIFDAHGAKTETEALVTNASYEAMLMLQSVAIGVCLFTVVLLAIGLVEATQDRKYYLNAQLYKQERAKQKKIP